VSGTSIPNGTYYYRVSSVNPVTVSSTITGGSSIPLSGVTGLAIGMSCSNANVPGTITFIGANNITMSLPVTSTISSSTVLHFAQPSTFADFSAAVQAFGSVSVSSNSGAFTIQLATDADTTNDVYTVSLYSGQTSTTALASTTITMQDLTPSSLVLLPADFTTINNGYTTGTACAGVRFNTDGTITTSGLSYGTLPTALDQVLIGNWVQNTAGLNSSLYTVSGSYTVTVLTQGINSTYTVFPSTTPISAQSLSVDRDFYVLLSSGTIGVAGGGIIDVTVEFNLTVTGPSNSDNIVVTARGNCSYFYLPPNFSVPGAF
jgi:hypothetical protein